MDGWARDGRRATDGRAGGGKDFRELIIPRQLWAVKTGGKRHRTGMNVKTEKATHNRTMAGLKKKGKGGEEAR